MRRKAGHGTALIIVTHDVHEAWNCRPRSRPRQGNSSPLGRSTVSQAKTMRRSSQTHWVNLCQDDI